MTTLLIRLLAALSVLSGMIFSVYLALTAPTEIPYVLSSGVLLAGFVAGTLLAAVAELLDRLRRVSVLMDPPSLWGTSLEEKLGLTSQEATSEVDASE